MVQPSALSHLAGDLGGPLKQPSSSYNVFCSALAPDGAPEDSMQIDRLPAAYQNQDERFTIHKRSYERQYAQLYFQRLELLRKPLGVTVAKHWPGVEVVSILNVGARDEGVECCVLGIVAKDMKLRPSVLDEYTKDRGLQNALAADSFVDESDKVSFEDDGGRMALNGTPEHLPVEQLVTGLVIAVRGWNEDDKFVVKEILYPGMPPQTIPRPVIQDDRYVALLSGLKTNTCNKLQLELMTSTLAGLTGSPEDQIACSRVVRLVIAGGSIGSSEALANTTAFGRQLNIAMQPIMDLDAFLSELAGALPVDIMPGAEDPANVAMPQQPLSRCLLPTASKHHALVRATNPHAFTVEGITFMGSSGQPVEDVLKYSKHTSRLAVMKALLEWRHQAPTAPDTLACYPFLRDDPFMMEAAPHVFFAGCQPEFASEEVHGPDGQCVRLIAVPSYEKTGQLVLLNLRTMECRPVTCRTPT